MFDDDWVWIEDRNRNPKTWLTEEEYLEFVTELYQPNKRVIMHNYENTVSLGLPSFSARAAKCFASLPERCRLKLIDFETD